MRLFKEANFNCSNIIKKYLWSSVLVKFETCQESIQVCFDRIQMPWTQPLKFKKIEKMYAYIYIYILNNKQYTKTHLFWKVLKFFDTLCVTATFSMRLSSLKFCKDFNLRFLPSHDESHYTQIISGYVSVCSIFKEFF